jgi:Uma2 family endonuclease
MTALPDRKYTLDEYIQLLKTSDERYEYFDGDVVSMSGGKIAHSAIASNVLHHLRTGTGGGPCQVFGGDLALKVPLAWPFRFPDGSVVCGEPVIEDFKGIDLLINPLLIVEVLSSSSAAYDLGEKFTAYQSIESFQEYLLISQTRSLVIAHLRQANGLWLRRDIEGLDHNVRLESLNLTLNLSDIYERVSFQKDET